MPQISDEDRPDLGFNGSWAGSTYTCALTECFGAAVYITSTPNRDDSLCIQVFSRKNDDPVVDFVNAIMARAKRNTVRHPYFRNIPDWLTAICMLHNLTEQLKGKTYADFEPDDFDAAAG